VLFVTPALPEDCKTEEEEEEEEEVEEEEEDELALKSRI